MSDSSDLSSAPSDVEQDLEFTQKDGILKFFSKAAPKPTPSKVAVEVPQPRKKRDPSPDHVFCLADNPDIAVREIPLLARSALVSTSKTRRSVLESTLTHFCAVHRHVPLPLHRGFPQIHGELRSSGTRDRYCRHSSRRESRESAVRFVGAVAE